jgi:hypothetical protein
MDKHEINDSDSFVAGWYFENINLCDKIIEFFKMHPDKKFGKVGHDKQYGVNQKVKTSIECGFGESDLRFEYYQELQKICELYIEKYPYCNSYSPWKIVEDVNIQFYPLGGGFHSWHTERYTSAPPNSARHLVFMTYLNTITDGGETEFFHQKIRIKPEKGLTIIWPADWTYTHRGIPSYSQEKIIVTGWFSYIH